MPTRKLIESIKRQIAKEAEEEGAEEAKAIDSIEDSITKIKQQNQPIFSSSGLKPDSILRKNNSPSKTQKLQFDDKKTNI